MRKSRNAWSILVDEYSLHEAVGSIRGCSHWASGDGSDSGENEELISYRSRSPLRDTAVAQSTGRAHMYSPVPEKIDARTPHASGRETNGFVYTHNVTLPGIHSFAPFAPRHGQPAGRVRSRTGLDLSDLNIVEGIRLAGLRSRINSGELDPEGNEW